MTTTKPHDPKKLAAMFKAWNDGRSWPEVAEAFGFATASAAMMATRNYAKRNGLKLRFANGNNDAERRAKSAAMRDAGKSLTEIAMELGWSDGGAAFRGIQRHERAMALARMEKAAKAADKGKKSKKASKTADAG